MGGSRRGHIRNARPTALLSAVATLFAALFVCLSPGPAAPGPGAQGPHHAERSATAVEPVHTAYVCPYGKGDCGLRPHLGQAVLTVPPPAAPLPGGPRISYLEPEHPGYRVACSGVRARAPDLHVLQVLRT
ncbi:hypothetical protein [Streptomyces corynorhini]|uniref:Uncharacterized protein n=1 Tax=Streptomyces corynorhini TaxID=2282652 RepID=A0A370B1S3_9ACTN|nr:hypothetical protein [Streptomyces corynorhini]RDG35780.1 hypothetical protein DVH02_23480 [Streptomyces corynorhini]